MAFVAEMPPVVREMTLCVGGKLGCFGLEFHGLLH